jgi:hypothetical protein
MRFLMKTLVVRPAPRLIHAFRQTSLDAPGVSLLSSCPLPNPARAIQDYWRGILDSRFSINVVSFSRNVVL